MALRKNPDLNLQWPCHWINVSFNNQILGPGCPSTPPAAETILKDTESQRPMSAAATHLERSPSLAGFISLPVAFYIYEHALDLLRHVGTSIL